MRPTLSLYYALSFFIFLCSALSSYLGLYSFYISSVVNILMAEMKLYFPWKVASSKTYISFLLSNIRWSHMFGCSSGLPLVKIQTLHKFTNWNGKDSTLWSNSRSEVKTNTRYLSILPWSTHKDKRRPNKATILQGFPY